MKKLNIHHIIPYKRTDKSHKNKSKKNNKHMKQNTKVVLAWISGEIPLLLKNRRVVV